MAQVTLACGCTVDDVNYSTFHEPEEGFDRRSTRDKERNKHHYPLSCPPHVYCISCDRFRPCSCTPTERTS